MQQKKTFTDGMDFDSSPEYLAIGKDRYRLNVRVMSPDNGNDGSLETMYGNTLVTYSLPAGTNKVIGSKEDPIRRKIYYFISNTSTNHSILEYDSIASTISLVFQNALLNFSTSFRINGIDIVALDANNHLLYWTDFNNEPRKINIEKAKYYTAGNYTLGYPTPFEARWITRIKQPSPTPPTAAWSNDTAQKINYLFKKNFTFKVQYVFDDNERSSYSPISNYAFPVTACDGTGEDIISQDNKLTVTVATGSAIVKKIQIVAKETNGSDYTVIAELDKSVMSIANDSTYGFTFYNNGNYVPVEVNESIKLFDNVPQKSRAQTLISGNRIVDGLIVEGYDPVQVDAKFNITYATPSYPVNPDFFPKSSYVKSGGSYLLGFTYYDEYGNRSGTTNIVNEKTTNLVAPTVNVYGTRLFVPFLTDPLYTSPAMDFVPVVGAQIYHSPPSWAKYYQVLRSKNESMDRYIQFVAENVNYLTDDHTTIVLPAAAAFVKVYINNIAGRYKDENPNSVLVYDFVKGDRIRFIANNAWTTLTITAPYAKAPAGGNAPSPTQYPISLPNSSSTITGFFSFNDTEVVSYDSGTGALLLKMNASVPNNLLPGVLFEVYQPGENVIDNNEIMFEMGECRPITTDIHGNLVHTGAVTQLIASYVSSTYVAPVFTATLLAGHGIAVPDIVKVTSANFSVFGVVTATTATTVTIDTTGYTLIGTYSGTSGSIIKAATFNLSGGDCFRRYQDMPFVLQDVNRLYSYVEAENASNMFPSKMWNVGRPNRVDPTYRQITRPSTVIYSEAFVPETFINGLSTVYDQSFQTYEDKYGGIYKLSNRNHQLTVYQELKVGGLPVGQVVFNGTTGGSVVGSSAEVLPEVMEYYAGDYGIGTHPDSHTTYANVEYFMDVRSGTPVRLSTDGLTPIGDTAFMHNFFTDICQQILAVTAGSVNVYGVYDTKNNEYIVAIDAFTSRGVSVPARTLAFNEKRNQWSSFYSYAPEAMCRDGINIVTFKNGALYTHNTNVLQANFYGVQYQPEIWGYLNDNPSNNKIAQAITLETSSPWELISLTTPGGQSTSLATTDFTVIENQCFAEILRDANTPNVIAPALPIFEGDPMRDYWFLYKIRYPLTSYNKLFAIDFRYIASNLHP